MNQLFKKERYGKCHLRQQIEDEVVYSVPDSEYDDTRIEYKSLKPVERDEHLKELWRLCFLKSLGASQIKIVFSQLHERVIKYGTINNINVLASDFEKKILEKKPWIVLLSDHPFRRVWDILMLILLLYVVFWVPVSICFFQSKGDEEGLTTGAIVDLAVDFCFLIDMFVNFISAFEDQLTGLPIVSLKDIAINYLTSWFVIDFIAVLPT